MKKIFFDTEFTGLHQQTTLISMAFVAESGEEFYAEFTDYDKEQLTDWLMENVISNLILNEKNIGLSLNKMHIKGTKQEIKKSFEVWLDQFVIIKDEQGKMIPSLQIWGDVPHWDWVLFCELFGGALNIPKQINYMPMDVATQLHLNYEDIDEPRINQIDKSFMPAALKPYNALYDAFMIKLVYTNKVALKRKEFVNNNHYLPSIHSVIKSH